jgi:uncharacterized protein
VSSELIVAMMVVLAGGIISGLAGFGFTLVVSPPLLMIYEPATVTAVSISLTLVTGWIVLLGTWKRIEWRTVGGLLPGALIGVFLGAALIRRVDADYIKLLAGSVVVLFALSLTRGWNLSAIESRWAPPLAGVASGTLNTSTGMAGPPVALLFATRQYDILAFRASIIAYFYFVDAVGMAVLVHQDVVGLSELEVVVRLLPAAIAGGFVGRRLVGRFSQEQFRRVTLVMLLIAGSIGAVTAIRGLIA